MDFTAISSIALISLLAAMSPGPDFAMVTKNSLSGHFTLATDERYQLILCKSIFKRIYDRLKKEAEKAAKAVAKAFKKATEAAAKLAETIAHGTKKAVEKTAHFVKEHKKETLIAAAVITAIAGAFIAAGALGGAATAGSTSKKKEDEDDPKASSPPPEPVPDWAKDLVASTTNSSEGSLDDAKKEAHQAWDLFGNLKSDLESELGSIKSLDPNFDSSRQASELIYSKLFFVTLLEILQSPKTY